jgi:SNF2 family DNA or RNA helicase
MLTINHLHAYQLETIDHIYRNTHCGVFLEMGLGKTVSTLTAFNILKYEEAEINKALVIAPKRVAESVWPNEINNWTHLKHLKISVITGTEKQRKKALFAKADIYTISRDNIAWLCGQFGGYRLPFDMLILDELSSFKNPNAVRFKALKQVQPSFKRVIGLTGTPAPNGLIDLWSQLYLIDQGARLGKYISNYRSEFFSPGKSNGHIVYKYNVKKEAVDKIYQKIGDICISMKARDFLNLPDVVHVEHLISLPDDIQCKYDVFEEEQILAILDTLNKNDETNDEEQPIISAVNAAGLTNKLLQFANGAVYDENKAYHVFHDEKIKEVESIIEEAQGKPVLIAWSFRSDLDRLLKALKKYKPRELKNNQDIADWNAGKIQVLLLHPASGGHGLNLQAGGNIVVWFGQTWSLELYQQLNARLDRQGQKSVVYVHAILIKGTMDIDVAKARDSKNQTQAALMEAVKARVKKYYPGFQ